MNKIILRFFLFVYILPSSTYGQWAYHTILPMKPETGMTGEFMGAAFINNDTVYYSYYTYPPSPSGTKNTYLKRTGDDCKNWTTDHFVSDMGSSSYGVKYFSPNLYHILNWRGFLHIYRKVEGGSWQFMTGTAGYYKDMYAHDSGNYKLITVDYNGKPILRFFTNNTEVKADTFFTYKPTRIVFPMDTLGVLMGTFFIQRFTPSKGYSLVFQDSLRMLSDIHFPTIKNGYVTSDSGIVYRTMDSGNNWTSIYTGHKLNLRSVFFVNDSVGYVVGDSGLILKTTNYGTIWQKQETPYYYPLDKVHFVTDSTGYIMLSRTLLKTTNGGYTWLMEDTYTVKISLQIYPNPASRFCNISIPYKDRNWTVSLYDVMGRCVRMAEVTTFSENYILNIEDIPRGIYVVHLSNGKESYLSRLVVE